MQAARQAEKQLGAAAGVDIFPAAAHQLAQLWVEGIQNGRADLLPRRPPAPQTMRGAAAKGVTAEEVAAVLQRFHALLPPTLRHPQYIVDHDRANDAAFRHFLASAPSPLVRAPHPVHGPDFNRPVEHFHSAVKAALRQHLLVFDAPHSPADSMELLERKAHACYKADGVRRDVEGLPQLWAWVATSDGGWPPRKLR